MSWLQIHNILETTFCITIRIIDTTPTAKYFPATPPMTLREGYKKYGRTFLEHPGIVGTSCAIFTYMLGSGRIKTKGVVPPEGLTREERDAFIKELTERGFVYKETVERNLLQPCAGTLS